ncbi:MAG: DNA polymerase III subunit alpha, partial [Trichlorobacter sp.]|uniref:DNA polymerase III subunit alpha n=1 Tax=Trichlorobacter sp. TaxID=2911007 RepID=UPI00255D392D
MSTSSFVHLHVHTEYSLLDSTIRIRELVAKAVEYKMPAVAITDTDNMSGAIDFYVRCRKAGIKPIIGAEVSITSVLWGDKAVNHVYKLVLLCMNTTGYRNLCRIVSAATEKGLSTITPVSPAFLSAHSDGLICLSGGKSGELAKLCGQGSEDAVSVAAWYRKQFQGRFYIELFPEPTRDLANLSSIARELDIPLVVAADSHCLAPEDVPLYEVLQCMKRGITLEELGERSSVEPCLYPSEVMWRMFGDCPETIFNTLTIVDRCNLELQMDGPHLPRYESLDGRSSHEVLLQRASDGLQSKMPIIRTQNPAITQGLEMSYSERLQHELESISAKGLSDYFLVVAEYVNWAKDNGIPVGPGRGAVGGSLVAYALGITAIDPIQNSLIFERFLNPLKQGMFPDIYLDFCAERRKDVVDYIVRRFSREKVCHPSLFECFDDQGIFYEVGSIIGMAEDEINRVLVLIPEYNFWEQISSTIARDPHPRIRITCPYHLAKKDKKVASLLNISLRLHRLIRRQHVHAACIIIAPDDLLSWMPIADLPGQNLPQSHLEFRNVERLGLINFYLFGLKNLSLNDAIVKLVQATKDPNLSLELLPLDDHATYRMFASGETNYVFQFGSSGIQELLKRLQPSCFEDVVAARAIYRPGPLENGMVDTLIDCKHGRKPVAYILPELEPILENTYGVLI